MLYVKTVLAGLLIGLSSLSYAKISDPEIQQALLDIYEKTGGFAWNNSEGWSSSGPITCNAYGITCDGDNNLVGIRLSDNGLMGHESPDIGSLDQLEFIHLTIESYNGMAPIRIRYPE